MKSHQQMEDHEPSDLIPLFNGMIISFINYELQVRIEPKHTNELANAKFENYGPLGNPTPASGRHPVELKTPAPHAAMAAHKEEIKQQPHFEKTSVAQEVHAVHQDGNSKVAQTDKVSLAELKKHDQHSPAHSRDGGGPVEHQAQVPERPKDLIDQIWDSYDRDHSGMLSKSEMLAFVKEYLHKAGEEKLSDKQFNAMFAGLDVNHDDQISKAEMKAFIEKVKAAKIEDVQKAVAEVIQQEEVKDLIDEIWAKYDQDHSGQLSNAEMKSFVKEYLDKLGEGGRLPEK
jgi:Ca2+-binding EF-hand superfamily protein